MLNRMRERSVRMELQNGRVLLVTGIEREDSALTRLLLPLRTCSPHPRAVIHNLGSNFAGPAPLSPRILLTPSLPYIPFLSCSHRVPQRPNPSLPLDSASPYSSLPKQNLPICLNRSISDLILQNSLTSLLSFDKHSHTDHPLKLRKNTKTEISIPQLPLCPILLKP